MPGMTVEPVIAPEASKTFRKGFPYAIFLRRTRILRAPIRENEVDG